MSLHVLQIKNALGEEMIEAWFDGCCEPKNPGGHAAFGVVLKVDGEVHLEHGGYVGSGAGISNNVAEYAGVNCALKAILALGDLSIETLQKIKIYGDSQLVVNQMNGIWKSRGGAYVPYMQKAKELRSQINSMCEVKFIWIPREKNERCDFLSKKVLKDKGIVFRIQPEEN